MSDTRTPAKPSQRLNFTEAALSAIQAPESGRVTYKDTGMRGLELRVSRDRYGTATKVFSVYRWVAGRARPERITLGRYPDDFNLKKARIAAGDINQAIAKGENPAAILRAARGEMSLGEAFEEYFKLHLKKHSKCPEKYRAEWEWYLGEMPDYERKKRGAKKVKAPGTVNWQNRPISSITQLDVEKMHTKTAEVLGKPSANHALKLLRAIYNKMIALKLHTGDNPAEGVKKFDTPSRDRFLSSEEAPLFFEALSFDPNVDTRQYILLCILTGARKSNTLAMRWEDINFDGARWKIPGEVMKNGEPLVLPLVPAAIAILRERQEAKAHPTWVFPSGKAKEGHRKNPYKAWKQILVRSKMVDLVNRVGTKAGWTAEQKHEAKNAGNMLKEIAKLEEIAKGLELNVTGAGLASIRIHDLRRTLGSWMAASGASTVVTAAALGHKTLSMALIYQRLQIDPVRAAMETATSALMAFGGAAPTAVVTPISQANQQASPATPDQKAA